MINQKHVDRFYINHGKPCCAGCDWWRFFNAVVGECSKSAPVSAEDRIGMLNIQLSSCNIDAGHIMTKRDHVCGDFIDTYKWPENQAND